MRPFLALSIAALFATHAAAEPQTFGKPLQGLEPTTRAAVLEKQEHGKIVALEGTIKAVCQEKGCWLTFEQQEAHVHVTFEGYSFFVPKDSAGQKVRLEGKVLVKQRAKGEVEHLEGEGATQAAAAVSIEATGVVIDRAAK